jgi:hypothetical protein
MLRIPHVSGLRRIGRASTPTLLAISSALAQASSAAAVLVWFIAAPPATAGDGKDDLVARAQAMIASSGVSCTLVDAGRAERQASGRGSGRHGGRGGGGGGPGGSTPADGGPGAYEVACQEGVGFILFGPGRSSWAAHVASSDAPASSSASAPQVFNCLEAKEAADWDHFPYRCQLKANRDQLRGVQAIAAHVGVDCTVSAARGLGHTADRSFFEIACAKTPRQPVAGPAAFGYVLVTDRAVRSDDSASAVSCIDAQANPRLRCSLTKVGATVEAIRRFVVKSQPDCVPASQRLAGVSKGGGEVFEIACQNGAGYRVHRSDDGAFDALMSCGDPALAGKCGQRPGPKT